MVNSDLLGSLNIRRISEYDEMSIMNDFSSNIDIVRNGQRVNGGKLLDELYGYDNQSSINNNRLLSSFQKRKIDDDEDGDMKLKKQNYIEPGQVDPNDFFNSGSMSLKNIIDKSL